MLPVLSSLHHSAAESHLQRNSYSTHLVKQQPSAHTEVFHHIRSALGVKSATDGPLRVNVDVVYEHLQSLSRILMIELKVWIVGILGIQYTLDNDNGFLNIIL